MVVALELVSASKRLPSSDTSKAIPSHREGTLFQACVIPNKQCTIGYGLINHSPKKDMGSLRGLGPIMILEIVRAPGPLGLRLYPVQIPILKFRTTKCKHIFAMEKKNQFNIFRIYSCFICLRKQALEMLDKVFSSNIWVQKPVQIQLAMTSSVDLVPSGLSKNLQYLLHHCLAPLRR